MADDSGRKTILIIEDDQAVVASLSMLLKANGYAVLFVSDGMYGIKTARRSRVDLIILDLGIPAGGGLFVLENLRKGFDGCAIPIIILTGKREPELEARARALGVSGYMHKPFNPTELLARIKALV